MASGNNIIVSGQPKGVFTEGIIFGTPKPGTVLQLRAGVAKISGRFTWEVYAPGTDGDRRAIPVLLGDDPQGAISTDAYVSGARGFIYFPIMGEELNMLKGDVVGTADDFAIGDMLMVDTGTGKVIATTGSPESEAFQCLEAVVDPTADVLVHCMFTGN